MLNLSGQLDGLILELSTTKIKQFKSQKDTQAEVNMKRFKVVLNKHSLDDYNYNLLKPVFRASSPNEAINIATNMKKKIQKDNFEAHEFLYALIVSADLDLDSRYND